MTVPFSKSYLIILGVTLILAGASFTLAHHQQSKKSHSNASSQTAVGSSKQSPLGVVENPPRSVTIDGKTVPLEQGTKHYKTANGTATVTVDGNKVTVRREQMGNAASGSSNVTVQSSSSGFSSSTHTSQSVRGSTVSSSSTSTTTVTEDGNGTVNIQSKP